MKKILVIEDDSQVRDNIQDILSLEEFCTITAADGLEGLSLVREEHPDLIICDVMMPNLSGYDVLMALRQDVKTRAIPFVFLTAKADKNNFRQGMELGADDYLTKPFTPNELRQAIATRLEKTAHLEQETQHQLGELRQKIAHLLPHELNTPLNGIINGVRLLRYYYVPSEHTEAIEVLSIIESSADRLQAMTQNFITYAELELITADPREIVALRTQQDKCSLMPLINSVATQKSRQHGRESDLRLEIQSAWLNIPEHRFKKVIEETIDNAFKFSSSGSPVQLITRLRDDFFHLFVIDFGRGMTAEQIAKVGAYMQFQRKIYEQQGSGLGLAIAKRIVELYGGELVIESFPNQQTIVRISLPVVSQ